MPRPRCVVPPLVAALWLLGSCTSNPSAPSSLVRSVTFFDKGAVVPDPVATLVSLDKDSIAFVSTQSGDTLESWTSSLSTEDFSRIVSIIDDNRLMEAPDPSLPSGFVGCVGHQGMTIVMMSDAVTDTLNISGLVWCAEYRTYWPPGLAALVDYANSLVDKYSP